MIRKFNYKIVIGISLFIVLIVVAETMYNGNSQLSKVEHIKLYQSDQNAYPIFAKAGKLLSQVPTELEAELETIHEADAISQELRDHLNSNKYALEVFHRGLTKSECIAPFDDHTDSNTPYGDLLGNIRDIGRVLHYHIQLERLDGHNNKVLSDSLTLIHFSHITTREGSVVSGLVGIHLQAMAILNLEMLYPKLSDDQLKELFQTLETIENELIPVSEFRAKDEFFIDEAFGRRGILDYYIRWRLRIAYTDWDEQNNAIFNARNTRLLLLSLKARIELFTRTNGSPPTSLQEVMGDLPIPLDPFSQRAFILKNGVPYSEGYESHLAKRKALVDANEELEFFDEP